MPQPTASDVHVNRPLTNISVAYVQNQSNFIAAQVFPALRVNKQSDLYFTYPKGYWFRSEVRRRAPGTETPGIGSTRSTASYFAPVYGVHIDVDDQVRANTDQPLDADRDAALLVTQNMLVKRDQLFAATYFTTGVWGTDITGVSSGLGAGEMLQWDVSGSDPVSDVQGWSIAIEAATGFQPNTLVIGPYVLKALLNHSLILDRIKYTERGIVSTQLLASLFGVDRVLIARAVQNTANEGAADSFSFIFGKHALLCYSAPSPSIMQPSAGYTFSWTGYLGAEALGMRVKRFRHEPTASDRIEMEMAFDLKVVASDLGLFVNGAVS